MARSNYNDGVFINCPFDEAYRPLFRAMQFTVLDCGFQPRSALEEADSSVVRIEKIYEIIRQCRYGIHDISRTESDGAPALPRFNMPFELGVFLAAKRFGQNEQRRKVCLILDLEQYRYQKFLSDIAGQDIRAHNGSAKEVVKVVRDWLSHASRRKIPPSAQLIWRRYEFFQSDLPGMCNALDLDHQSLNFVEYQRMIVGWLEQYT
ncbi:MAG: hypothetical protein IT368_13230 [Candidatus Hydrogenedentes bacterium]|nr:hypothetical protein [Candidatus Hydrogenedentota bacterium]